MLTISANKLGGICLIIGPLGATIFFILLTMVFGDSNIEPTEFSKTAVDIAGRTSLETLIALLPPIFLVLTLYGLSVLRSDMNSGDAVWGLAQMMFAVGVFSFVVASALTKPLEFGLDLSNGETMAALNGAVSSYGGLLFTVGTILIALVYASNKEGGLKIGAYIVALVFLVSLVVQVISWIDTSVWSLTASVAGISYIVVSVWNVFVGRDLLKKA
ncbi:MAG: hypothetical protein FI719_05340 [SAR202 cluster bacterium]|nr:hypothetical protein [SAR202 cluster bacterium]|tara:strand:- start:181 stop:828 length:648 start_codon:yes stop_codon:yes gene_type:complete